MRTSKPSKIREFFTVMGEAASVLPALNYCMGDMVVRWIKAKERLSAQGR